VKTNRQLYRVFSLGFRAKAINANRKIRVREQLFPGLDYLGYFSKYLRDSENEQITTFPENENGPEEPFPGENIKLLSCLWLFRPIPIGRN
jgi:hypothetical protein